jgi:hypothetical protein
MRRLIPGEGHVSARLSPSSPLLPMHRQQAFKQQQQPSNTIVPNTAQSTVTGMYVPTALTSQPAGLTVVPTAAVAPFPSTRTNMNMNRTQVEPKYVTPTEVAAHAQEAQRQQRQQQQQQRLSGRQELLATLQRAKHVTSSLLVSQTERPSLIPVAAGASAAAITLTNMGTNPASHTVGVDSTAVSSHARVPSSSSSSVNSPARNTQQQQVHFAEVSSPAPVAPVATTPQAADETDATDMDTADFMASDSMMDTGHVQDQDDTTLAILSALNDKVDALQTLQEDVRMVKQELARSSASKQQVNKGIMEVIERTSYGLVDLKKKTGEHQGLLQNANKDTQEAMSMVHSISARIQRVADDLTALSMKPCEGKDKVVELQGTIDNITEYIDLVAEGVDKKIADAVVHLKQEWSSRNDTAAAATTATAATAAGPITLDTTMLPQSQCKERAHQLITDVDDMNKRLAQLESSNQTLQAQVATLEQQQQQSQSQVTPTQNLHADNAAVDPVVPMDMTTLKQEIHKVVEPAIQEVLMDLAQHTAAQVWMRGVVQVENLPLFADADLTHMTDHKPLQPGDAALLFQPMHAVEGGVAKEVYRRGLVSAPCRLVVDSQTGDMHEVYVPLCGSQEFLDHCAVDIAGTIRAPEMNETTNKSKDDTRPILFYIQNFTV